MVFVPQPAQGSAAVPPLWGWAEASHKRLLLWWEAIAGEGTWQGSLAPCPIQPSQARGVESLATSLCLVSSLPRQPYSPRVPYLQDLCLVAEAGEIMMGLAWKKLSSQIYSRTRLSSAMSTHTSTENSAAQLLQKLFLPIPLQQPGSFVGWSHTGKAPAMAATSFHCVTDLVHPPGQTHPFVVHIKLHIPGRW